MNTDEANKSSVDNIIIGILLVFLLLASIYENGLERGLWVYGSILYGISVFIFVGVAIPSLAFRTMPTWPQWLLLGYALAYSALTALMINLSALSLVTVKALAAGSVFGIFLLFRLWRQRTA